MQRLTLVLVSAVLLLSGCAEGATPAAEPDGTPTESSASFLDAHGLADKDAAAIVDELDRLAVAERPTDLMASVRPDELVLSDGDQEVALEMPEDRFYVSVAPYVAQTHECFHHSLTTCRGELSGEEVDVRIVGGDGEVLVEKTATTFDNGFVGFWLPRGAEGTIEVGYDGRSGAVDFTTDAESATCVTTLRLT